MTNDTIWLRRKFDEVSVDKVALPLFIQAESPKGPLGAVESFIEIRTGGGGFYDHPDLANVYSRRSLLFMLANAEFRTRQDPQSGMEGDILVKHPYAKDDERDTARVASLTISSMQFGMASTGTYAFSGWLTDMRFYVPGEEGDYFTEYGGPNESDYKDIQFPYQPPRVQIKSLHLPIQVEAVAYHRGDWDPQEYWTDVKKAYDEQKAAKK